MGWGTKLKPLIKIEWVAVLFPVADCFSVSYSKYLFKMPVKTRSTSKKFRDELHDQIIKMYSFKNIGITKCFDIVNRLDLDGHTVHKPEAYIKLGIHPVVINTFVSDHYCYGYDSPPVSGVYALTILYHMNRVFELKAYTGCIGRGTQADYIREAMEKRINEMSK